MIEETSKIMTTHVSVLPVRRAKESVGFLTNTFEIDFEGQRHLCRWRLGVGRDEVWWDAAGGPSSSHCFNSESEEVAPKDLNRRMHIP